MPRKAKKPASAERAAGLLHFNAGRFDAALACFRKARALGDRSAGLRVFLAHARESTGRFAEIESLRLRAQAALSAGDPAGAQARVREALALGPRAKARRGLRDVLRACGDAHLFANRHDDAAAVYRGLLKEDARDARAALHLAAVMRALARPAAERALLARALRHDRGTLARADRFRALMKIGRHREAVAQAERILDDGPTLADVRIFWDPWEWDDRRPRRARRAELRRLERSLGARSRGPWLHYYRAELLGPEGLEHFEALRTFPPRRYGWMFAKAGLAALCATRFEAAASWLRIALRSQPADWRTHGFLAEAYLCLKRPAAAFAELAKAARTAPPEDAGPVLAWRGALDLWLGRYDDALRRLEEACRLDAPCAYGWRAAALLKLGRPAQALTALDETLRRFPRDFESYVWRGEAKRELGLYAEALSDLNEESLQDDRREPPIWLWALINRALVKAALGDKPGLEADYGAIPAYVIDHIRARTGLADPEAVLRAALDLSRGFRREEYRQAIWMT